jgi:glutamate formiminotransferase
VITADKQQARVVTARIEICIQILEKIDLTKHKFNIKEIFDLLAVPSLFHTSYEVRMGAVELIGNLFRHLGECTALPNPSNHRDDQRYQRSQKQPSRNDKFQAGRSKGADEKWQATSNTPKEMNLLRAVTLLLS